MAVNSAHTRGVRRAGVWEKRALSFVGFDAGDVVGYRRPLSLRGHVCSWRRRLGSVDLLYLEQRRRLGVAGIAARKT